MSLYSYLNRESIVINKLIAFTQEPKFATLMELLMKSEALTTNKELRFTTPDDSTEIRIYNSRIKILVERGYPYEKALLATIELDSKAGTYTLTNVDSQRYENIGKIIDDLNYLFYQGLD